MGLIVRKPVLFPTKRDSNQSPQLQSLARKLKFSREASLDMILSKKRKTMALISLRGCAGWSVPLLVANPEDRFSRVEAQIKNTAENVTCCNILPLQQINWVAVQENLSSEFTNT